MSADSPLKSQSRQRTLFFVIVGLAAAAIACCALGRWIGWFQFCGGILVVLGGVFFLLAEDRRWPVALLLLGLALFFGETLLNFIRALGG
jgi:hypothetical protein